VKGGWDATAGEEGRERKIKRSDKVKRRKGGGGGGPSKRRAMTRRGKKENKNELLERKKVFNEGGRSKGVNAPDVILSGERLEQGGARRGF